MQRLISYRKEAGPFDANPLGWILHTQDGNGSLYNYFNGLRKPNRKFSHIWVSKTGAVEQYQTLDMQSWAQMEYGNEHYWSAETEGKADEPLTRPQITSLARFHNSTRTADTIVTAKGQRGIGIHSTFVNTACPGTVRARQRQTILMVAKSLRTPAYPGVLQVGSTGNAVRTLQKRLAIRVDGEFGPVTKRAVVAFQVKRRLSPDGIVGPITWKALW